MSVFKKLRGTFQTAQQDIVDGLRSLTLFEGSAKSEQLHHIKSKDIDLDVGADLLHQYQETWSCMQNETKMCSKKAEEVDVVLAPMFTVWDKRAEMVADLEEEVKTIPTILSTLKELHALLETLRQDFQVTETGLSMIENLCEEQELKTAVVEETKKLNLYRTLKAKETENVKVTLARTHVKKMQDIESSKSMRLKERAEAFTSQFQEDVDYYKTHGKPDSKMVTEFPKVTSLSDIDIPDDGNDLDTFLGPQTEEEQDTGAEEMYIEDDYTTDFSVKEDLEAPDDDEDFNSGSFVTVQEDYYSNDENENVIQDRGTYPNKYLIDNSKIDTDGEDNLHDEAHVSSSQEELTQKSASDKHPQTLIESESKDSNGEELET